MQGRRVDDSAKLHEMKPGDYSRQLNGDGSYFWYGVCPNGLLCNLTAHNIVEHDDKTITVDPSILCSLNELQWHGYLKRGVWEQVA
jgi:hypothetical protein